MAGAAQLAVAPPSHSDDGLVLVVEDDAINRTVVLALLAERALQTAIACDGRVAIEMVARDHYDAILMDCMMPELDGFQATREIRAAEYGSHVPIIAMTALTGPADRARCLGAGMDDYLTKPLFGANLNAALDRWLAPAPPRVSSAGEDPLDHAALMQLRETLTPALRAQLLDVFAEQQARCIAEIVTGARRGERDRVRRAAHLLKGSSATLGASELGAHCQELERTGRAGDEDISEAQLVRLQVVAAEASTALRERLLADPDEVPSVIPRWLM
jgi:CheY-like chemotaxis protein